jgi:glycerophosphoryl diester phosphodiesterase
MAVTALFAGEGSPTPTQQGWKAHRFQPGPNHVQVYAHRGARCYAPENTLPGYAAALRKGADFVDLDVVVTKDHELLVAHDLYLNPDLLRDAKGAFIAGGRGRDAWLATLGDEAAMRPFLMISRALRELQAFDAGSLHPDSAAARLFPDQLAVDGTPMPTLREVIRYVKSIAGDRVDFQIEMKTDTAHPDWSPSPKVFAELLHRVLKVEQILDRCEVQAFDWRCLEELRRLDASIHTAFLTHAGAEKTGDSTPRKIQALGGYCWDPQDVELTQADVVEAHRLGLKVVVWRSPEASGTVMDPALLDRLLAWGVDGIITDDPARLSGFLAARGRRLPPRFNTPVAH